MQISSGLFFRSFLLCGASRHRLHTVCSHSGSPGLQARVRPLPLLIASGSGYLGYNQYERYKDGELEKLGIEVPPRLANELQVRLFYSSQLWVWACQVQVIALTQIFISVLRWSAFALSAGSVCSIVESH